MNNAHREGADKGVFAVERDDLDAARRIAETVGLRLIDVVADRMDRQALLRAFTRALALPAGMDCDNWDALADLLRDLSWRPGHGGIVLVTLAVPPYRADGDTRREAWPTLADILEDTHAWWRDQGEVFWTFVSGAGD